MYLSKWSPFGSFCLGLLSMLSRELVLAKLEANGGCSSRRGPKLEDLWLFFLIRWGWTLLSEYFLVNSSLLGGGWGWKWQEIWIIKVLLTWKIHNIYLFGRRLLAFSQKCWNLFGFNWHIRNSIIIRLVIFLFFLFIRSLKWSNKYQIDFYRKKRLQSSNIKKTYL